MLFDVSEARFEAEIEHVLRNEHGYRKRLSEDYNRDHCLIPQDVIDFIRGTQPEEWNSLRDIHKEDAETRFLRHLAKQIDKRGTLDVLRNGVKDSGQHFALMYPAPTTSLNPEYERLYEGNIFSVVRQLQYNAGVTLSLDLALFVNGLPIFTAELKNNLTGQNVRHARQQYREKRDTREPLFKFGRCLAHFAVDPRLVDVTTHLQGVKTRFLPFNKGKAKGAGNPNAGDKFPTHYLWEEVWAPDSVLNLLEQFIHITERHDEGNWPEKQMIFPRYHQLDAVRRLVADAQVRGTGQRYLVQHSAGSGKSYSIAWLAHQLSNLHNESDERVFDSVIVITDRRVLDDQLQEAIWQFQQTLGVVENINKSSRQLRKALEDSKRIIVSTLQKFPFIVNDIGDLPGKNFAVIVDEAHSSQSGESVKSLKETLSDDELNVTAGGEDDLDVVTWEDRIAASIRARKQPENISMFAFTATPKNKTLELFGVRCLDGTYEAFSLYSMKQAIDERFILDVLKNYTTYTAYWRLFKTIDADPAFESRKAKRLLQHFVELSEESIAEKIAIIVEHFHEQVVPQIKNRAKAMIVTRSRRQAVRFYLALKRYLAEQGYDYGALVAFSGRVDDDGVSATEAELNGFPDTQTANELDRDEYHFLVVANKFQTGFDQPLLAAMYVNKRLSGVHAVQTLSRLNRMHTEKEATMVLDFINPAQHIREAFQPYYEATLLSEGTDLNLPYDVERKLREFQFYSAEEVSDFARALYSESANAGQLQALLAPVVDRVNSAGAVTREEFRSELQGYTRLYAFIAQIIPYEDKDLEMLYQFARYLWRLLPPGPNDLPTEIFDLIDLESYRLRETNSGSLTPEPHLEMLEPMLENETYGAGEDPIELLSEIVQSLNDRYGPAAAKMVQDVFTETVNDVGVSNAIRTNPPDKARLTVEDVATAAFTRRHADNMQVYRLFSDDEYFRRFVLKAINQAVRSQHGV